MRFGKLQLLCNPPLAEFPQLGLVPQSRHLIDWPHQFLRPVHLTLRRFSQQSSHHPLQRLKKHHGQKQQQRCRSFGRQIMLPPQTRSPHKTQVKQCYKHHEHCVDQIPLPPDLQKVELLYVSNQQPKGNKGQEKQKRGESCPHFRPPDGLEENHHEENYGENGKE